MLIFDLQTFKSIGSYVDYNNKYYHHIGLLLAIIGASYCSISVKY